MASDPVLAAADVAKLDLNTSNQIATTMRRASDAAADLAGANPSPSPSPQSARPSLPVVPEETVVTRVEGGLETTELVAVPHINSSSDPPSPVSGRNLASMPRTPRLSTEAKPVVLKINLSTSRMNLLNDDPSLTASPIAFYEKLKEVANTSELAGLLAQGWVAEEANSKFVLRPLQF